MVTAKPAPELASTYSTNIRSLVWAVAVVEKRRKLEQMQKRPHHKTLAGVIEIAENYGSTPLTAKCTTILFQTQK